MLRALALFFLVLYASPATAQEYQSKELAEAGAAYRQELIDRIPANKRQPSLIARLRSDADAEYRAKRYAQAIDDLGNALLLIGRDYDRHDKQKEALAAFQAGIALTRSPAVAERIDQLKRLVAFR